MRTASGSIMLEVMKRACLVHGVRVRSINIDHESEWRREPDLIIKKTWRPNLIAQFFGAEPTVTTRELFAPLFRWELEDGRSFYGLTSAKRKGDDLDHEEIFQEAVSMICKSASGETE